ncbi:glycosyltransferase family 2 protein [Laspinema sp. D1]|uniref:glycosyltransferase family 2 protein n=1 Tax=Laspinema palackyanum TaxID=3231601 RepID=UPI0034983FD1|nr:glycosyltransferase family 2 protein [Laspinema sp. D2b]
MTTPKVSIGMPVYNGEPFIREALDSLLAQTFTDFELIISDNASTDGTEAICQEYAAKDKRIRYIRQTENRGAAANFQFVLDEAVGEYFMWAAHDDTWTKDYLLNATNTLTDRSISFCFPTFKLRSIHLHLTKYFDHCKIFKFIESMDRRERVLSFMALHHHSHKCNIVYSLFRTDFLRYAHQMQAINNDGALGAVILGLGRGKMVKNAYFIKRYRKLWPGALSFLYAWFYKDRSKEFDLAKSVAIANMQVLFPEYIKEIKLIVDLYKPYSHGSYYRILGLENKFSNY